MVGGAGPGRTGVCGVEVREEEARQMAPGHCGVWTRGLVGGEVRP